MDVQLNTTWEPIYLQIDLTEEKILPKKPIRSEIIENFLGGRGITVYLGYHEIPTDASPRGVDNSVILGTGILTGSLFPSSGMTVATYKSPLTNTLFTSTATGKLGAVLRTLKLDFLRISGIAKAPKFILIDEFADITFENAEPIWRMSALEADSWLRKKYGEHASIVVIGQAAINQIAYAGAALDRTNFFRRGGMGAVLASKNIKAIVITEEPEVNDSIDISKEFLENLNEYITKNSWCNMLSNGGTLSLILSAIQKNVLPAKNCSRLLKLSYDKIKSFKGYNDQFKCWQCAIKCQRMSFQDFVSLGPNLKIIESDYVQNAIEECDQEALDPLSTGAALGSLFNIQEDRRKLLDINLGYNWGHPEIHSLIQKIISLEGIGDQLSRGESYLYQLTSEPEPMIKNQMGGMYYYPNILGVSLSTSVSTCGSDNFHSDFMVFPELLGLPYYLDPQSKWGKPRSVVLLENLIAIFDSLVICTRYLPILLQPHKIIKWVPSGIRNQLYKYISNPFIGSIGLELNHLTPLLQETLDGTFTFRKLITVGNRITLLERMFNTRMGLTHEEDRFQNFIGNRPDFFKNQDVLLKEYYQLKGLTTRGLVSKKTLEKMDLIKLVTI